VPSNILNADTICDLLKMRLEKSAKLNLNKLFGFVKSSSTSSIKILCIYVCMYESIATLVSVKLFSN
jgi:hypothetical protein